MSSGPKEIFGIWMNSENLQSGDWKTQKRLIIRPGSEQKLRTKPTCAKKHLIMGTKRDLQPH